MSILSQPAHSVPVKVGAVGKPGLARVGAGFAFIFSLTCFFPNPALPIGSSTGLQASQILALLFVPVLLFKGVPKRHSFSMMLVTLSMAASGFYVVLTGRAITDEVVAYSTLDTLLALLPLLPLGWLIGKGYSRPVLCGVAWGIVANALMGAYQLYSFSKEKFPLLGIYQNPSFGTFIQDLEVEWALYVQRPFGFFPEPSAMSASMGPWLVFMLGLLIYPGSSQRLTAKTKALLVTALIFGLSLIIASQSGFMLPLMASLLVVTLPTIGKLVRRVYRPGSLLMLTFLCVIGVVLVIVGLTNLGDRLGAQNESWQQRGSSIVWGITYLVTDPGVLLLGVGPGQSFEMLLQAGSEQNLTSGAAVWSVAVLFLQEKGLLGGLALFTILGIAVTAIARSSRRALGLGCLLAWLGSVILTTSYVSLSPVWLLMGVFLVWEQLFGPRSTPASEGSDGNTQSLRKASL